MGVIKLFNDNKLITTVDPPTIHFDFFKGNLKHDANFIIKQRIFSRTNNKKQN